MTLMRQKYFLVPLLLVTISIAISSCSESRKTAPNVIFITLDTTRADHIGVYGNSIIKTPHLDKLANDSVVFKNCYSTSHSTIPAHTSMFTSLYLKDHGVTDNGGLVLPDFKEFMPKIFKEKGYNTAAFTSGGHLSPTININQGFDDFFYPEGNELIAEKNNIKIFKWLDQHKEKPFFIWTHYFDPHRDYNPPAPYDKMYALKSDKTFSDLEIKHRKHTIETPKYFQQSQDPEYYRNLYKGEISYLDHQIGELTDKLKERDLYENSLIVVVADHGEYLGEHTLYFDHRGGIYDEVVHVPMFIKTAKSHLTGFRDQLVSIIDIFPTIMDLLNVNLMEPIRGISLVNIMEDNDHAPPRDRVYYESAWRHKVGVKTQEYTFTRQFYQKKDLGKAYGNNEPMEIEFIDNPVGRQLLFNNKTDKRQTNNLAKIQPEIAAKFEKELRKFSSDTLKVSSGVTTTSDKKHLEKLKALGYIR